MDTGATAHIITDKSKFLTFDETFKSSDHYLELADGSPLMDWYKEKEMLVLCWKM